MLRTPCHCDNCDWKGVSEHVEMISDIQERLDPGSVVPVGQCPECGALAYLNKNPFPTVIWVLTIGYDHDAHSAVYTSGSKAMARGELELEGLGEIDYPPECVTLEERMAHACEVDDDLHTFKIEEVTLNG